MGQPSHQTLIGDLAGLRDSLEHVIAQVSENQGIQSLLRGVARSCNVLLANRDLDAALPEAVALFGQSTTFEAVTVVRRVVEEGTGDEVLSRVATWRRGKDPEALPVPLRKLREVGWLEALERGEVVRARAADQPEPIRQLLIERRAPSILFVPILGDSDYWGMLIFGSLDPERSWSEVEESILRTMATAIAGALSRQRAARREMELQCELMESRKLESLGLLARGVAHDLSNVLQSMQYHLDLLDRRAELAEELSAELDAARKSIDRAGGLVRQLRQYAGRGAVERQRVPVESWIRDSIELVEPLLPTGVTVELDLAESLPDVLGDPSQLGQVLSNLLVNAGEAIGDGKGTIGVRAAEHVRPPSERRWLRLEVTDDGPGIDEAELERVFEPFFSTKGRGRGLGLAAVAGIVRTHRGRVDVESAPGSGTTFGVLLPVHADTEGSEAT